MGLGPSAFASLDEFMFNCRVDFLIGWNALALNWSERRVGWLGILEKASILCLGDEVSLESELDLREGN